MINSILKSFFLFFTCLLNPLMLMGDWTVELRTAAFFPASDRFRDVYEDVGACYEIEVRKDFCCCYEIWGNLDYYTKHAHIKDCCGNTQIDLLNIGSGINYVIPFCACFQAYMGIGINLALIDLTNKSCMSHRERSNRVAIGGLLKSGICYHFTQRWFLDIFMDYLYQPVHYHQRHAQVGGLKIGGGLGIRF